MDRAYSLLSLILVISLMGILILIPTVNMGFLDKIVGKYEILRLKRDIEVIREYSLKSKAGSGIYFRPNGYTIRKKVRRGPGIALLPNDVSKKEVDLRVIKLVGHERYLRFSGNLSTRDPQTIYIDYLGNQVKITVSVGLGEVRLYE